MTYTFYSNISNDGLEAIKKSHTNKHLLHLPSKTSHESRAECNYGIKCIDIDCFSDLSHNLRTMHLIGVSAFPERRLDSEPVRSFKIVGSGGSSH